MKPYAPDIGVSIRAFILLLTFFLTSCAGTPKTEDSKYQKFTLVIDPRVTTSRDDMNSVILKSINNIRAYAKNNGWENLSDDPVITTAEVVFDRKQLEKRLIEIFNVPADTPMPPGLTAANNSKDLLLIMPEEESKEYSKKFVEPGFYEKLITHELAHIFHIKTLNGDESKMGPIWFYEGFPVVVSRQLEHFQWSPSKTEVVEVIREPKRGDYRQYGWMVRKLLKKHDMKTLVQKAGATDFNDWAIEELF